MDTEDIITLVISGFAFCFSLFNFIYNIIYERKVKTIEAYNRLQKEVFDEINAYSPAEIKEILEDRRSSESKTLSGYMARINHFCIGLDKRIYDFNTFYELSHGYFDSETGILQSRIVPIIEKRNNDWNYDYYKAYFKILKNAVQKQRI